MTYFGIEPREGDKPLTYGSYLRVNDLLGLQNLLSDPPRHDELLFIIVHQVYELWFRQLLHEVDAVVARLGEGQALPAQRLLRRCIEIQRVLIEQLRVLETMTPNDFLTFRDHLMPASGFQSAQFRALEIVSGLKSERHLANYEKGSPEHTGLEARLAAPTIADAFHALLRARGFDAPDSTPAAAAAAGDDDPAREQRIAALVAIYHDADAHYDLFLLCEALIEYDQMFTLWRFHHVAMVERMIGSKPGTGGSSGAAYLRKTVEQRFFPELWEMRTRLSPRG